MAGAGGCHAEAGATVGVRLAIRLAWCALAHGCNLLPGSIAEAQDCDEETGRRSPATAERWLAHRAGLQPRTIELYSWLLSRRIVPYLGAVPIASITPDVVRGWRATLLGSGMSESAAAYRLLRAVLMTAAEDGIIPLNP